jgi:DegV family protein with EDD domain
MKNMSDFILSCCSTADLTDDYFKKIDVPYVCFHFYMNGETYYDDLGKSVPLSVFYQEIKNGGLPTTSQVNVQEYVEFFEPYLKEGKDILHIALSSGISGSFNSACAARDELSEKYPERKIFTVDSLAASSGYGLLMTMASKLRDEGKTIDEVHDWVETRKLNINHWVCVSDLAHLKRGGRISATSAIAGSILNICPLIDMNSEGKLIQRKKIRGKKQIMLEILKKMETHAKSGINYSGKCFISNSACPSDAEVMRGLILEKFKNIDGDIEIFDIGTVIGAHVGPGTFAIFFYGDTREK